MRHALTRGMSDQHPLGDKVCSRRLFLLGTAATLAGTLAACGGGAEALEVDPSEIPVGSAKVFGKFIIAQPTEGKFVAYSSRCPHQGARVADVEGDRLVCPSHGSEFSIADGSVLVGPARDPLEPASLKAADNKLEVS